MKVQESNGYLLKLWYGYRFIAVGVVNTLVGLVLLNVILSAVFLIKDYFLPTPGTGNIGRAPVEALYPGLNKNQVKALREETNSRPVIYEPFTQFKERPYQGKYVNVDRNGFRITKNQHPWPPPAGGLNIFLFGGSTTFGYGVSDDETIASHLQDYLTIRVGQDVRLYNFGRGWYYSTQERILFEELLASGLIPDLAIFMDGLNDFYYHANKPQLTYRLSHFVAQRQQLGYHVERFFSRTALMRAIRGVRNQLSNWFLGEETNGPFSQETDANANGGKFRDPKISDRVLERYQANKKIIEGVSSSFGVQPIFVWQPVPMYQYDLQYHPTGKFGSNAWWTQYGYERMADRNKKNELGNNFLWCGDIQKDEKQTLYVDTVHYSAGFSKTLAMYIANLLIERGFIEGSVEPSEELVDEAVKS